MKDCLGKEASIGDYISVITKENGKSFLGFGIVKSVTAKGNLRFEYLIPKYKTKYIRDSRFLIVNEKESLILKEKLKTE